MSNRNADERGIAALEAENAQMRNLIRDMGGALISLERRRRGSRWWSEPRDKYQRGRVLIARVQFLDWSSQQGRPG